MPDHLLQIRHVQDGRVTLHNHRRSIRDDINVWILQLCSSCLIRQQLSVRLPISLAVIFCIQNGINPLMLMIAIDPIVAAISRHWCCWPAGAVANGAAGAFGARNAGEGGIKYVMINLYSIVG